MTDLTDDELDEMAGDGTCTHLPFVRAALEIRRRRETEKRLEEWAAELETSRIDRAGLVGPFIATELRNLMRGG